MRLQRRGHIVRIGEAEGPLEAGDLAGKEGKPALEQFRLGLVAVEKADFEGPWRFAVVLRATSQPKSWSTDLMSRDGSLIRVSGR